MTRRVHSPEGHALAVGDQHDAGRMDAVQRAERSRRHAPVLASRLPSWSGADALREALAAAAEERRPTRAVETVRTSALYLSRLCGGVLVGEDIDAADLRAAEDDVLRAIAARRRAS